VAAGGVTGRDVELRVVPDAASAAREAAEQLAEIARRGGHIALSGGSTPRRAYKLAALLEPDWGTVEVWWGDERCVPPDDERSNYRLARESLLDHLRVAPQAVHRIRGELTAEEAADLYERELGDTRLSLNFLGIGPDGHTASLFPNAATLDERERRVVPAKPQLEPTVDRVTLTIPALSDAEQVLFLVTGTEKAEAAARAFAWPPSHDAPASLVRSTGGRTKAILDAAAAARLEV
jgi:6-phosphogluconolactonase